MFSKIIVLTKSEVSVSFGFLMVKNITVEPDTNNHLLNTGKAYRESRKWTDLQQYINDAIVISTGFYDSVHHSCACFLRLLILDNLE